MYKSPGPEMSTGAESRETARDVHNEISLENAQRGYGGMVMMLRLLMMMTRSPPLNGKRRHEVNLESPDVGPNAHRGAQGHEG